MWLENLQKTFIINWMVWFFLKKFLGWGLAYRFKKNYLIGSSLLYNIVVFSVIRQHESATVHMYTPVLNAPPLSLPTLCLWVVQEHWLWGALLRAWNLYWPSVLHMVIDMFQCYSLKSSHPYLLPHSSKVCSLHLCLFCCLAYRVAVTSFLNSIHMH